MYTLATRLQRVQASLVDGTVVLLLTRAAFSGSVAQGPVLRHSAGGILAAYTHNWSAILFSFFAYHVLMLYFYKNGQSPGKAIMKIQVVRKETGETVGMGRMLLREWVGKFASCLMLGIGYLNILWDKNHQGWHDKVAGTVVIKRDSG